MSFRDCCRGLRERTWRRTRSSIPGWRNWQRNTDAARFNSPFLGFSIKGMMLFLFPVSALPRVQFPVLPHAREAEAVYQSSHLPTHVFFTGTTKIKNLHSNIGSLKVKLTHEDLKEISDAVPADEVAGDRIFESALRCSWKHADTPPRDNNGRA